MPSPPPGPAATLAAASQVAVQPNLIRRSSFEPMRIGLGSLPPPNFSKAPPGQRSVPAVEFFRGDKDVSACETAHSGLSTVPGSGSNTPSVALGNGVMASQPWNLWTDSSVPGSQQDSASVKSADDSAVGSRSNATNKQQDEELASALAASVVLSSDKVLKRATSLKHNPTSTSSSSGSGAVPAAWPEEFAATSSIPPQSFALDPSASPERAKASASSDLSPGGNSAATGSLLPRNVSFFSMLDLPATNMDRASPSDKPVFSPSDNRGSPLTRTTSLNRRLGEGSPTSVKTILPTTIGGGRLPSVPDVSEGAASAVKAPGAASSYTAPGSNSYGAPVAGRQTGASSPVQSRDAFNGTSSLANPMSTREHANNMPGTAHAMQNKYGPLGSTTGGHGNFGRNLDFSYMTDDSDAGSIGQRARQMSAATTFSDGASSIASLPFGPALYGQGTPDAFGNGVFAPFGSTNGFGSSYASTRRDSGYGISPYNPTGYQPRRTTPNTWQMSSYSSPQLGRSPFMDSPFSNSGMFGGASPYSLRNEGGMMGMHTPPSQNSSSSSLYRYPSSGSDYLPASQTMPNYGLGLVGPASPYLPLGMHSNYEPRPRVGEGKSTIIRSPLLEEFRADKNRQWVVKDMLGHIAEFMTDQVGSRYIQEYILENPTEEDCDLIYEEVFPVILQLSVDVFANFCVQRLFEKASTDQIANMAHGLKGSILRLSLQTYGCRVIQKAVETVSPETQLIIIREIEQSIHKCVRDQNANHVIQKIIQTVPADSLRHVVESFVGHVYTFATHPYSCRVLQRILENCPERMTRPILDELKGYAQNLMQDQYGNYVIQFVLEKGHPLDKSDIITQIYGQVLHLSKHKFASNVIEKCIMNANEAEVAMIAGEVLTPRVDGTTGVASMLRHEYANYPLQRLLKHSTGPLHQAIVQQVSTQLTLFRCSNPPFTAKHLIAVEKLLLDVSPDGFPTLIPRRFEDHYLARR